MLNHQVLAASGGVVCVLAAFWSALSFSALAQRPQWADGFHFPGFDNAVKAAAVYDGDLYVGGYFDRCGDQTLLRIARWNGVTWDDLGGVLDYGPDGVECMLVHDGDLYVGGTFLFNDGHGNCRNIARWDGANWHPMGEGFSGRVYDLEIYDGKLIACGSLYYSGSTVVQNVAWWTGGSWQPLTPGSARR